MLPEKVIFHAPDGPREGRLPKGPMVLPISNAPRFLSAIDPQGAYRMIYTLAKSPAEEIAYNLKEILSPHNPDDIGKGKVVVHALPVVSQSGQTIPDYWPRGLDYVLVVASSKAKKIPESVKIGRDDSGHYMKIGGNVRINLLQPQVSEDIDRIVNLHMDGDSVQIVVYPASQRLPIIKLYTEDGKIRHCSSAVSVKSRGESDWRNLFVPRPSDISSPAKVVSSQETLGLHRREQESTIMTPERVGDFIYQASIAGGGTYYGPGQIPLDLSWLGMSREGKKSDVKLGDWSARLCKLDVGDYSTIKSMLGADAIVLVHPNGHNFGSTVALIPRKALWIEGPRYGKPPYNGNKSQTAEVGLNIGPGTMEIPAIITEWFASKYDYYASSLTIGKDEEKQTAMFGGDRPRSQYPNILVVGISQDGQHIGIRSLRNFGNSWKEVFFPQGER